MLGVLHYEHTHTHTRTHTHTHSLSLSLSHTHTHTHTYSLSLSLHPTSTPPRSFGEVLFWCSLGHETKGLLRCGQDVKIQQLTKRSFSPFSYSIRLRCHGFQTPVLDVRVHFTQPILKRRFSDCSVSGCGGGRTRPMLFTLSRLSAWFPITDTGVRKRKEKGRKKKGWRGGRLITTSTKGATLTGDIPTCQSLLKWPARAR